MAGYRRKTKLYTLKWAEDQELHGLEVTAKGLSVDSMIEMVRLYSGLKGADDIAGKVAEVDKLFRRFAGRLVSWNLEDDEGRPVPATYEGVAAQDLDFVIGLVGTWIDAVASVDSPLPQGSTSGQPSGLEASIPMEPLSPSRLS